MKNVREKIIEDFLKNNKGKSVKKDNVRKMLKDFIDFGEIQTCFDSGNLRDNLELRGLQKDVNNKHITASKLMKFINDRNYGIKIEVQLLKNKKIKGDDMKITKYKLFNPNTGLWFSVKSNEWGYSPSLLNEQSALKIAIDRKKEFDEKIVIYSKQGDKVCIV